MNSRTINLNYDINQDATEFGDMTKNGLALTSLLHNLICEYGKYHDNSFVIKVDDLSVADKRLLLSHFESPEWYEYACESELKTNELFSEGKKYYQEILDDECFECYQNAMQEMRDHK